MKKKLIAMIEPFVVYVYSKLYTAVEWLLLTIQESIEAEVSRHRVPTGTVIYDDEGNEYVVKPEDNFYKVEE